MSSTLLLIESALKTALTPTHLEIVDDKNDHIGHANQDSGHFTVLIESPAFAGKTMIAQHRMVYEALGSLMKTHIHALRIRSKAS